MKEVPDLILCVVELVISSQGQSLSMVLSKRYIYSKESNIQCPSVFTSLTVRYTQHIRSVGTFFSLRRWKVTGTLQSPDLTLSTSYFITYQSNSQSVFILHQCKDLTTWLCARTIPTAIYGPDAIVIAKDCACPIRLDSVISLVLLLPDCLFPIILNLVDLYFLSLSSCTSPKKRKKIL